MEQTQPFENPFDILLEEAPKQRILRKFADNEHTYDFQCPCGPRLEASDYAEGGFIIVHNRFALVDPTLLDFPPLEDSLCLPQE